MITSVTEWVLSQKTLQKKKIHPKMYKIVSQVQSFENVKSLQLYRKNADKPVNSTNKSIHPDIIIQDWDR